MKKILMFAYLRNNLGDDLFVKELLQRYPNTEFYIRVLKEEYAKPFKDLPNAIILKVNTEDFTNLSVEEYDGYIYIGGSIFMEGGKVYNLDEGTYSFLKKCKEKKKPFFYISSNYGPYQTQEYFKLSQKVFASCADICFRDKYSYNLFKEIETVRYAPDLIFSYNLKNCPKIKNTIGISLIDLEIRNDIKEKEKKYITCITNNIRNYVKNGMKIYLFSFCEHEGDEKMFEKIKKVIPEEFEKRNVEFVQYKGDINEFLNIYKQMEYMICERFHSLILSYVCKQKNYVLSYSEKINNVIEELKLCNSYLNLKDIEKEDKINLKDFTDVDEKKLKILKDEAEKQFEAVDRFLKN